jgi:UDPglucose--hexose-1-phosphate uridylyltransferase
VQVELENTRARTARRTGDCLVCRINGEEKKFGKRVIHEKRFVHRVHSVFYRLSLRSFHFVEAHRNYLSDLSPKERDDLAEILKIVTAAFDKIFDRPFPYMMVNPSEPGEQSRV